MQEVAKAEQKVCILEVSIKKRKSGLEGKIAKYQLKLKSSSLHSPSKV